jgi:hypothetical protein
MGMSCVLRFAWRLSQPPGYLGSESLPLTVDLDHRDQGCTRSAAYKLPTSLMILECIMIGSVLGCELAEV